MNDVALDSGTQRSIALKQLHLSDTESQRERRKHMDKALLEELTESIKSEGVLVPIIVRPAMLIEVVEALGGGRWYAAVKRRDAEGHNLIGPGYETREQAETAAEAERDARGYQIVAGERRVIAARKAGLTSIDAKIRSLTDEQVIKIQVIENLQREGLHELAEAEGYEALQQMGHSADEIADMVGKSRAYVYGRIRLLTLQPKARAAFYDAKISASVALIIARIPVPKLQEDALKAIISHFGEPMTYRQAQAYVQREFMTRLAEAGFPTEDASLVPDAGPCATCPKRTGNQPQLFGDVKGTDVCTDPVCFKAKREAHAKRQIAVAEEAGRQVITGKKADAILPYGPDSVRGGYVALTHKPYQDPKKRSVGQLLGKTYEPILVQDPQTGTLVKVAPEAAVKKALKEAGVKSQTAAKPKPKQSKADAALRDLLFAAIHAKAPRKINQELLVRLAEQQIDGVGNLPQMFFAAWGWDADTYDFAKLGEPDLCRLLFEVQLLEEISYNDTAAGLEKLVKTAKSLGVDVKKVRADAALAVPAPVAKNKAGKKI